MEWHLADKEDIFLRSAMWESYNKKCVYCGIALEPRHMQIDHIVPIDEKKLEKSDEPDLQAYLKELENKGFDKNSIENYALACSDCNNKKRNYAFSAANFRFFHENAARYSQKINKKYNKYKRGGLSGKITEEAKYFWGHENVSNLTCEKIIISSGDQVHFSYGLGEVRIDAFIRFSHNEGVSCLISFKELSRTPIFITYENEEIKEYLFSGYNTDVKMGKRRWYVCYDNISETDIYEIRLPHIRLKVSFEAIEQMAKICDALHEEYLMQQAIINNILGTLHFPKNEECRFKLFAIRSDVWNILYSYMKKKQYTNPEYDDDSPFVLTNSAYFFYLHKKGTSDNYAQIHLVHIGDYYDVLWTPTEEIVICEQKGSAVSGFLWTAEHAYDEFVNEYIPAALMEYERNEGSLLQSIFRRKKRIEYNAGYLLESGMIRSYWEE